jgi:hypothetical protein
LGEFSLLGRLFTFGSFENYRSSQNCGATSSNSKNTVLILTKNGLANILGYFSQSDLVTLPVTNRVARFFLTQHTNAGINIPDNH